MSKFRIYFATINWSAGDASLSKRGHLTLDEDETIYIGCGTHNDAHTDLLHFLHLDAPGLETVHVQVTNILGKPHISNHSETEPILVNGHVRNSMTAFECKEQMGFIGIRKLQIGFQWELIDKQTDQATG